MAWRDTMDDWTARLQSLQPLFLPVTIAAVLIAFAPARVAATLFGVLAGIGLSGSYISRVRPGAQTAIFWIAVTVSADAAYARWTDQAPLTIVNAFSKFVDGAMKLVFPLIQNLGFPVADPRYKVVAVAPDFIWALTLSLVALMSLSFAFPKRRAVATETARIAVERRGRARLLNSASTPRGKSSPLCGWRWKDFPRIRRTSRFCG